MKPMVKSVMRVYCRGGWSVEPDVMQIPTADGMWEYIPTGMLWYSWTDAHFQQRGQWRHRNQAPLEFLEALCPPTSPR